MDQIKWYEIILWLLLNILFKYLLINSNTVLNLNYEPSPYQLFARSLESKFQKNSNETQKIKEFTS
jgi:hypothetical protein